MALASKNRQPLHSSSLAPRAWYDAQSLVPRLNKRRRVVFLALGSIAAAIITFQLVYPYDRGLPLATVAGQPVPLATHETLAKVVTEKFNTTRIKLAVGSKSVEFDLKKAGAEPNTELMIEQLSGYPLWLRLLPGSVLYKPAQVSLADVYYTQKPFQDFVEAKTKELNFPPQNARLSIKDGTISADEAIEGSEVKAATVLTTISKADIRLGTTTTIKIPAKRVRAERYAKDLESVRQEAAEALGHTVTIAAGEKKFTPSKKELASWILLDDANGKVTLRVDKEKIKAYLMNDINKEVGVPAGQTNITIVDGRETGRTTGASGRTLAADALADQIAAGLLTPPSSLTVAAQFTELLPSVIYNSKYTTTEAGLRAYATDLAATRNIRISIQQLDGGRWQAGARDYESTPSGSTFKLYVALVLFDKMDKGEIHWDDPMLDTTVTGCFERMTVASTNPCAEAWIAQFGRQYINDFIYARGFSTGTTFISNDATRTTAADLTKFMTGLNDGSLVKSPYRERLLDSLGRHPYRYGIPTGSQGVVHDKVGFLWDYVHDTAIVNHPKGNYIMTIMTKGYSYATIASITREVERIMYP